jgi:hypothetical protein
MNAKPLIMEFSTASGTLKLQLRFGSGKVVKPETVLINYWEIKKIIAECTL